MAIYKWDVALAKKVELGEDYSIFLVSGNLPHNNPVLDSGEIQPGCIHNPGIPIMEDSVRHIDAAVDIVSER